MTMTKINAIPVALLERAIRLCNDESDYFQYATVFEAILAWWRSDQNDNVIEAAIADGDLPADWYASSADWPDPITLDAATDQVQREETVRGAAREDLAALNDGLQALGALAAMILRISERLEGATT